MKESINLIFKLQILYFYFFIVPDYVPILHALFLSCIKSSFYMFINKIHFFLRDLGYN